MKRKKIPLPLVTFLLVVVALSSCVSGSENKSESKRSRNKPPTNLILATTTSTQDSGLLDEILPMFEKKYNIRVKTIAVGTGEAIALGKRGETDVILVHSREAEDKFVREGYGKNRKNVMCNDFVVVGPFSDPAEIKGEDPVSAFKKIAEVKATFVSRDDDSGTHKKEKKIWEKAGITPSGNWYIETGQGMGETLRVANEKDAHTLADRGTYLAQKDNIDLRILIEKDKILFNPYGVIAVNPKKHPKVNYDDAMKFINWITSYEVQKIIKDFGKDKYGQPLFVPNSDEWKAKLSK